MQISLPRCEDLEYGNLAKHMDDVVHYMWCSSAS